MPLFVGAVLVGLHVACPGKGRLRTSDQEMPHEAAKPREKEHGPRFPTV